MTKERMVDSKAGMPAKLVAKSGAERRVLLFRSVSSRMGRRTASAASSARCTQTDTHLSRFEPSLTYLVVRRESSDRMNSLGMTKWVI